MTEEEKEDMAKLFGLVNELRKMCEPYRDVEPLLKNTASTLSERFYQEHFIMAGVLEAFFFKNEISFNELNKTLVDYVPKEFVWDLSVARIELVILKMVRLGLVEAIETANKYAPDFKITEDGIKACQAHTFQTLATSSFFSYQTYRLNKKANRMSGLMLVATIVSVMVAMLSVVVTIWVSFK